MVVFVASVGVARHWGSYGLFNRFFGIFVVVLLAVSPLAFRRGQRAGLKIEIADVYWLVLLVALLFS